VFAITGIVANMSLPKRIAHLPLIAESEQVNWLVKCYMR